MEEYKLKNGVTVIYVKREGEISSFCIGFNAGASVEKSDELGLAHVVEHMLFKGTKKRNEEEINKICNEVFGFHNAMTNYPYSIYYGTTLSSDFEKGFEIYSDILLNPSFPNEGFKEEIGIILEELKEWKDDPYQECEDELFSNAFKIRRIKDLIIGTEKSVLSFNLDNIKNFYNKHYNPRNCTVSIVSSLPYETVIETVNKYFGSWEHVDLKENHEIYELNMPGIYTKIKSNLSGAKIMYCFPIHHLNSREISLLKIFNQKFGEGTNSILYKKIRTEKGLVYDINSYIKDESSIKLLMIKLGTSTKNIENTIKLINDSIERVKYEKSIFTKEEIGKAIRSLNLKKELSIEKSIELCKKITTHYIMYKSAKEIFNQFEDTFDINEEDIMNVVKKVIINPSIQILRPN